MSLFDVHTYLFEIAVLIFYIILVFAMDFMKNIVLIFYKNLKDEIKKAVNKE